MDGRKLALGAATALAVASLAARRRRGARARRGSLSRVVDPPKLLYHGTAARNLLGIVKRGALVAGGGYSPHRTKTRDAVFLTDEPANAAMYGSAFGRASPFAVFEVDTTGLTVLPDYDDSGLIISIDLEELERELVDQGIDWKPAVGAPIPDDDMAQEIEWMLESFTDMGSDRPEPTCLSVAWEDDQAYLYAEPYLCQGVATDALGEWFEHESPYEWVQDPLSNSALDIFWSDTNTPCLLVRQYMVSGSIPLSAVRRVLVSVDWLEGESSFPAGVQFGNVLNPGWFQELVDEHGRELSIGQAIEAGRGQEVAFATPRVAILTVDQLRSMLAGSKNRRRRSIR